MTHDEQRKRIFELECALGTSIKISEQLKDQMLIMKDQNKKLCDINETFANGIQMYVNTMNKQYLLSCVKLAVEQARTLKRPIKRGAGDDYPIIDLNK